MKLNYNKEKIEHAIRENSKKSFMILDLVNSVSWVTEEKLFIGKETKNKIEITRIKKPLASLLPNLIIVFKKGNMQNPKIRLTIFGYALIAILHFAFFFVLIKKILDSSYKGDGVFAGFILFIFIGLFGLEYFFTKRSFHQLKKKMEEKNQF
jgi:hypothetical protein